MNEHEEKTIKTFFQPNRKERYFSISKKPKKRNKWLDKLNHSPGLNNKYIQSINSWTLEFHTLPNIKLGAVDLPLHCSLTYPNTCSGSLL